MKIIFYQYEFDKPGKNYLKTLYIMLSERSSKALKENGKCFRFFSGLTLKLPLFFRKMFPLYLRCFASLIPESFRKTTGNRPEKERKHFPEKERNLLSFKVRFYERGTKFLVGTTFKKNSVRYISIVKKLFN